MRIAMTGLKGILARCGGIEKHTEELATRLAAKGHKVTVYRRSRYTNVSKDFKGVRMVGLPTIRQKHLEMTAHTFLSIMHLFLPGKKKDIIHIQSADPATLSPLAKSKTNVVVTSQG